MEVTGGFPDEGIDIDLHLWNQSLSSSGNGGEEALLEPGRISDEIWAMDDDPKAIHHHVMPIMDTPKPRTRDVVVVKNPRKMDVLSGRSYRLHCHYGNIQFRKYLKQHRDEYNAPNLPRGAKRKIAMRLIHRLMEQKGVRFLKKTSQSNEWWTQSSMKEVEEKVCQYFRELRK